MQKKNYKKFTLNKFYNSLNKRFKFKRRKGKRKRGKHIYSLFLSRKKNYSLYYQPFDSGLVYSNFKTHKNCFKINLNKKKYRIGLKSYNSNLVRISCLKSLKYCSQRNLRSLYLDKFFKYNVSVFPDYWLTAKPKSVRMGKGKAEPKFKVFFLKRGLDVYNFRYIFRYKSYLLNKKFFMFKFNLFVYFLINILKGKPSVKCLIYKKFI